MLLIIFFIMQTKNYQTILCFTFLLIAITLSQNDEQPIMFPEFDEYLQMFGKKYDENEYAIRKQLYETRLKILYEIKHFRPAVNKFSDYTPEEEKMLTGLLLEKPQDDQLRKVKTSFVGAPTSLDWRDNSAVTQVKDQQSCGSCWAFAAVAYAQSKIILDGRYSNKVDLSEQRLLECTQSSSCAGGYFSHAMNSVVDMIPFEVFFPYDYSHTYGGNICTAPAVRIGNTTQHYYSLTVTQLEELVSQRPIAISLSASGWVNYGSGIFSCSSSNPPINHGVLLIGYAPDHWIIKNSWGKDWGEDGYIRINKTIGSNCGIGNSAHRTFQPHYTSMMIGLIGLVSLLLS